MPAFPYENGWVWTGENKTKTLVWSEMFYFIFVETKTDTQVSALVWSRPVPLWFPSMTIFVEQAGMLSNPKMKVCLSVCLSKCTSVDSCPVTPYVFFGWGKIGYEWPGHAGRVRGTREVTYIFSSNPLTRAARPLSYIPIFPHLKITHRVSGYESVNSKRDNLLWSFRTWYFQPFQL